MTIRLVSIVLPLFFFAYIIAPQVSGSRLPSSDESLKSVEGQLLGNSLMTEQQQEPHLSYYEGLQAGAGDLLQQEYEDARAYDQLVAALQQQLWSQQQKQAQQQPPIHVVQRSRILYPEEMTSDVRYRLNANRRFPPPPTPGSHSPSSKSVRGSGKSSIRSVSQSTDGHEQQKRPETQRFISGSGVSGLANFLTQSYGLGKDGSIGVRFGLS